MQILTHKKSYYAPVQTSLVFIFYIIFGVLIWFFTWSSADKLAKSFFVLIVTFFIIERIIRFSYHLEIRSGKIYEKGIWTEKRVIDIASITKIRWKKENFWTGGYQMTSGYGDPNWQRQFYIESPEHILPKFATDPQIIKDILKLRPDLKVENGGVTS